MQPDSSLITEIDRTLDIALREDIGSGDITSNLTIPDDATMKAVFVPREDIVLCGVIALERLFEKFTDNIEWEKFTDDGTEVPTGKAFYMIEGNVREILKVERTALNLLQHMSGIATLTSHYIKAIAGTNAEVLDTRKTIPGLREIAKYSVCMGGGTNHRFRLDDGIMIKDNHIESAGGITKAVEAIYSSPLPLGESVKVRGIEVECDTLNQVAEALVAKADILLLDNMPLDILRSAVKMNNGRAKLEASGGITLETIRAVAETGVDCISVGAITHSARSVDIGLDVA